MFDHLHYRAKRYREHGEPAEQIAELEQRARESLRKARWHAFLSGRPIPMVRL